MRKQKKIMEQGDPALMIDPEGKCLEHLKPQALVDAILAKKNLGTRRDMAPVTIGLGPGFTAGKDVDAVIETKRGHRLGRVIGGESHCQYRNSGRYRRRWERQSHPLSGSGNSP